MKKMMMAVAVFFGMMACNPETVETSSGTTSNCVGAQCEECASYIDCPNSTNQCTVYVCEEGKCVERPITPSHECATASEDEGRCWFGACCTTCIFDADRDGVVGQGDGVCAEEVNDTHCGVPGTICNDCTFTGQHCVDGKCVFTK